VERLGKFDISNDKKDGNFDSTNSTRLQKSRPGDFLQGTPFGASPRVFAIFFFRRIGGDFGLYSFGKFDTRVGGEYRVVASELAANSSRNLFVFSVVFPDFEDSYWILRLWVCSFILM
jgi:hypothetical protein